MEEDWSGQMGFQHRSSGLSSTGSLAEKKVAESAVNSGSMFNSSSHEGRLGSCYDSGWDPIVSLSQSENFGASLMASHGHFANPLYPAISENMGMRATSQFMQHCSSDDTNAVEMLPKPSVFGGGSFSGMVNHCDLPGCAQNSGASNKTTMIEKSSMDPIQSEEDRRVPEETSQGASPTGKRKKNAEGDSRRDASDDISDEKDMDEKKQKIEENDSSDQRYKQMGGQTKDNSIDGEASKGNYVHVRARKGQATNSHSLAERVRREKINDRMKLLQELVPGCNKITGKAVMLDEIINYVQSLQHQVEFLSMKLAAVNPELDFNIEQILSKDIFHSRGTSAPILGLTPGMSSAHLCATDIHQGAFSGISSTASPYHSVPPVIKGLWDGELQNLLHMGFESNPPISNLGPNGNSKS